MNQQETGVTLNPAGSKKTQSDSVILTQTTPVWHSIRVVSICGQSMLLQVNKLDLVRIFIRPACRKTRIHPGDNVTKSNFQWSAVCLLFPDWMQSNAFCFLFFSCIYLTFTRPAVVWEVGWSVGDANQKPNHATLRLAWSPPDATELKEDKRQNLSPTGSFAQNSSSTSLHQEPLFNHMTNKENDFLFPAYNKIAGLFCCNQSLEWWNWTFSTEAWAFIEVSQKQQQCFQQGFCPAPLVKEVPGGNRALVCIFFLLLSFLQHVRGFFYPQIHSSFVF